MSRATSKSSAPGAPTPQKNGKKVHRLDYDPDEFRMTVGEHLEDLRRRLFFALIGYAIVLVVCFLYGEHVVAAFCDPLVRVLQKRHINPQLVTDEVGEGFMVFIQISMISAAALASPWILYQLWQFIAAGLYPKERKYITRYLPLSIALLIAGLLFVYFMVLPWTLDFLIKFSSDISPLKIGQKTTPPALIATPEPGMFHIPIMDGDPPKVVEGMMWINGRQQQMKLFYGGEVRVIAFNANNLLAPEIKLSTYIDMVVTMLLIFGLSFQLPLVVLALERIGIVEMATLKSARRYVYFILAIAAAVITPGGDIPTMLLLTIPLCGLYELGIWLAKFGKKKEEAV